MFHVKHLAIIRTNAERNYAAKTAQVLFPLFSELWLLFTANVIKLSKTYQRISAINQSVLGC